MNKLKAHLIIALVTFVILFFTRFVLPKIPIKYGEGDITVNSVLFLFYGIYVIFVACLCFKDVFEKWKNNLAWEISLVKSYLLLVLFIILMTWLFVSGQDSRNINIILPAPLIGWTNIQHLFLYGLNILFPISTYTIILAIKSIIIAKKQRMSNKFGIILLILSIIILILSFVAFFMTVYFWLGGGIDINGMAV